MPPAPGRHGHLAAFPSGKGEAILPGFRRPAKAGERAAALTRQLLAFSRKQVLKPEVVDLGALVANLKGLLGRVLGEDIELVSRHPTSRRGS